MKSYRVLALAGLLLMVCVFLAGCSGGSKPTPTQPLTITSTTLPQATVGDQYGYRLQASGGSGTYTWSITAGMLPPGLALDQTALISGTPTTLGTYNFTAQVMDGANHTATTNLSIVVGGVLIINCNSCAPGTMHLPAGNPGTPYTAMLSVSGGTAPYTWCVVEQSGTCDDGAGGALPPGLTLTTDSSGNGVISGTPTTPGPPTNFTVQVTDSETIMARGSINLVLTIFAIGTTMLPNGQTFIPYNQTVVAVGGTGPYSWCVMESDGTCDNGTGGALPAGLSLNSTTCVRNHNPSCSISGTPTQSGMSPFTLQVTDGETPPATATQSLSITVTPAVSNSLLNGNYLFAINGYKNGAAFIMAGSFLADGNGNITGGKLDVNYGQGEPNDPSQCRSNPNCPIAERIQSSGSVYDLSAGNGLGMMTINTLDNSNNPHTYKFSLAVSSNACVANVSLSDCGRVIVRDPSDPNTYGSGILKVQDSQFFSINSFFPGNFALLVTGVDANGNRYAAAGAVGTNPNTLVDIDCNGNGWQLNGCPLDTNDNGLAAGDAFGGSFSADLDANTGRGNFVNIRFPNDPNGYCLGGTGNPTCGYAYYVVNKQEMILISGDPLSKPANLTLWQAYRQRSFGTGWSLQQLSGNVVAALTALNNGSSDVTGGLLTADGAGNGSFSYDENAAGTLSHQSVQGTYALGANGSKTGNFILSGFNQTGLSGASAYLYTGSKGYMVGTDANATSGVLEAQTGSSFTNASIIGSLEGGTAWPAVSGVTNSVAWMFADGHGNITATEYTSGPNGAGGPTNLTLTYQTDASGRAVVNDQSGNEAGVLYVVGPTKFVVLPVGSNPALSVFISGQPD